MSRSGLPTSLLGGALGESPYASGGVPGIQPPGGQPRAGSRGAPGGGGGGMRRPMEASELERQAQVHKDSCCEFLQYFLLFILVHL